MRKIIYAFLFLMFCAGFKANAGDLVTFKWQVNAKANTPGFEIEVLNGKKFSVDWGDGKNEVVSGSKILTHKYLSPGSFKVVIAGYPDCFFTSLIIEGKEVSFIDVSKASRLETLDCSNNLLESLDVSNNLNLKHLSCKNSNLVSLNVSNNTSLQVLNCRRNQISNLDLSSNVNLEELYCNGNALSLSDLSVASQRITDPEKKQLFPQIMPPIDVEVGAPIDLSADLFFGGVKTVFQIQKLGTTTTVNKDYVFKDNGILIFRTPGIYSVEKMNEMVASGNTMGKVINSYIVGNVEKQQISFKWKGSKSESISRFNIKLSQGKKATINWGDMKSTTITGEESSFITMAHAYKEEKEYTVTITSNSLDCFISYLDVEKSNILSLNLNKATAIEELRCANNNLSDLDVSKNTILRVLDCSNNEISTLNVSRASGLESLNCANNELDDLNLNDNISLHYLDCSNNLLTEVDVHNNPLLVSFICTQNQLTHLNVGSNTYLEVLTCSYNQLSTLDISNNKAIKVLGCSHNKLVNLDLNNNELLTSLICKNNELQTLSVNGTVGLVTLYCDSNEISSLDVSTCSVLNDLRCNHNKLLSLNITGASALQTLYCQSNQLGSLYTFDNTALTTVHCYENAIPLEDLFLISQKIKNDKNKYLGNQIIPSQSVGLKSIIDLSGHMVLDGTKSKILIKKGGKNAALKTDYTLDNGKLSFVSAGSYTLEMLNPKITSHSSSPAKVTASYNTTDNILFQWTGSTNGKNSIVHATLGKMFTIDWGDGNSNTYKGNGGNNVVCFHTYSDERNYQVTITGDTYDCIFTYLNVSNQAVSSIDVSNALSLNSLWCSKNHLRHLDVKNNKDLTILDCGENDLVSLNVSGATSLKTLYCYHNHLTDLDVNNNKDLIRLECNNNAITAINMTNTNALQSLYCQVNQLGRLDLTKKTMLTELRCYENALPLSDLYAISQKIQNSYDKYLGTQVQPNKEIILNIPVDLSVDFNFKGVKTDFLITKQGTPSLSDADYVVSEGKLTFKSEGIFSVEMTNQAVVSFGEYPVKVIATYIVGSVEKQRIIFKWVGSAVTKSFKIQATNGKGFTVNWGDGVESQFVGNGTKDITLFHDYPIANNYTVTITGNTSNSLLTSLKVDEQNVFSLDVSRSTALQELSCNSNQLTNLDISNNTILKRLECYSNKLTSLNLQGANALQTLYCNSNALSLSDLYEASQKIVNVNEKYLGTQITPMTEQLLNAPIDLSDNNKIKGEKTIFSIQNEKNNAIEGTDYILKDGFLTFKKEGAFTVTITNKSITSYSTYPPKIIILYLVKSDDAGLKTITVSNGSLVPAFNPALLYYTVNVDNDVSNIVLDAIPIRENASVTNTGIKSLNPGINTFTLLVTAEDKVNKKEYILTINRAKSVDATLQNLTISTGILTPAFSPNTERYTVKVPNEVTTITLNTLASHLNASVIGGGVKPLNVGNNPFVIYIVAEDGVSKKEYNIHITRSKSTDATLKNATVSAGALLPYFSPDISNYNVSVANNVSSITLGAIANHENTIIVGTGVKNLKEGNNTFTLQVRAEDGTTMRSYTITVNRAKTSSTSIR